LNQQLRVPAAYTGILTTVRVKINFWENTADRIFSPDKNDRFALRNRQDCS
jgi:hypothetical protein